MGGFQKSKVEQSGAVALGHVAHGPGTAQGGQPGFEESGDAGLKSGHSVKLIQVNYLV